MTSALLVLAILQSDGTGPDEAAAAFRKLLDRPKVAMTPELLGTERSGGRIVERLTFVSEEKVGKVAEHVPLILVRPEKVVRPLPTILVLHGFMSRKENMRWWLDRLADRGMIGVAIDARYHGERVAGRDARREYDEAIRRAWRAKPGGPQEHPWYYDTCWDVWRTLDYLESREDVDPRRNALMGFSMGGAETLLAGAVDERVRVAVLGIAAQSYSWSLEHEGWRQRSQALPLAHQAAAEDLGFREVTRESCRALWEKLTPGLCGPYDGPSLIRRFAGRPLLLLHGDRDPTCPDEGARAVFKAAEQAFARAGATERLRIDITPGGAHEQTPAMRESALSWLEKWLKE